MSFVIPLLGYSTFSSSAFSSSLDNNTVLQQSQKASEANQDQESSTDTDSSQEASKVTRGNASMSSLSPSTIDISEIDCDKVVYSKDWGLDTTLEVIKHCTGGQGSKMTEI